MRILLLLVMLATLGAVIVLADCFARAVPGRGRLNFISNYNRLGGAGRSSGDAGAWTKYIFFMQAAPRLGEKSCLFKSIRSHDAVQLFYLAGVRSRQSRHLGLIEVEA